MEQTRRVAVIDIGSNSVRMEVLESGPGGYLTAVEEARATLRLAREVDARGKIGGKALSRLLGVADEFVAIARESAAEQIRVAGTAAIRDAKNVSSLAEALEERWGLPLEILDGEQEARFAALGAIYGLPVSHGLLLDIGGGSMQLAKIEDRAATQTWSFRLGALRLHDAFLPSDPPTPEEVEALRHHVRAELASAGVPRLEAGAELVGTGGTVRTIARVARRGSRYPIVHGHGYELSARRLRDLAVRFAELPTSERRRINGLSTERADVIAAGALAVATVVEHTHARSVMVSGHGLRQGLARGESSERAPAPRMVRREAMQAVVRRFATWDPERAARRVRIASELQNALDPHVDAEQREALEWAATIVDVGSAVDGSRPWRSASEIVVRADLAGFSHTMLATIAALLRVAARPDLPARNWRPLLGPDDDDTVQRGSAILALADLFERRLPGVDEGEATFTCGTSGSRLRVPPVPEVDDEWAETSARIAQVFARTIEFVDEGAAAAG